MFSHCGYLIKWPRPIKLESHHRSKIMGLIIKTKIAVSKVLNIIDKKKIYMKKKESVVQGIPWVKNGSLRRPKAASITKGLSVSCVPPLLSNHFGPTTCLDILYPLCCYYYYYAHIQNILFMYGPAISIVSIFNFPYFYSIQCGRTLEQSIILVGSLCKILYIL